MWWFWGPVIVFWVLVVLVITNHIAGKTYVGKVLLAFDYFVCVLWDRDFDITISSRCEVYSRQANVPLFWEVLHYLLDILQPNHCALALQSDLARARLAIEILSPSEQLK